MSHASPASMGDSAPFLLATVDSLPQPYQVLGLVEASFAATRGVVPTASLWRKLESEARDLGADAVIGIRLSHVTLPTASRPRWFGITEHYGNVVAVATGTAIHRLPGGDPASAGRRHPASHPARRP